MHKRSISAILCVLFGLSLFISACSTDSTSAASTTSIPNKVSQSAASTTSIPNKVSQSAATPTIEGIATPDNWVTVNIYTTEGGMAFAPYKLSISSADIKGVIWDNQSAQAVTLLNSDLPSTVTPASLHIAAHSKQKLELPKNQAGTFTFHLNDASAGANTTMHCIIIRS